MRPVAVVPSPKSQAYVSVAPSGSLELEPVKSTANGSSPLVDEALATAVGAWPSGPTTVAVRR